jgi:hypothetical protein
MEGDGAVDESSRVRVVRCLMIDVRWWMQWGMMLLWLYQARLLVQRGKIVQASGGRVKLARPSSDGLHEGRLHADIINNL